MPVEVNAACIATTVVFWPRDQESVVGPKAVCSSGGIGAYAGGDTREGEEDNIPLFLYSSRKLPIPQRSNTEISYQF